MVNPASTALHLPESVSHGQSQQAQGNQWQCHQTEKQTSIRGSFQNASRSGPFDRVKPAAAHAPFVKTHARRTLQFCLITLTAGNGRSKPFC
jgi:hypothetical protein